MSLRPGASEVYRIAVLCDLVEGRHHEVRLRLKADNRVTFEGACDWRTARAVEHLSSAFTCRVVIDALKTAIRAGHHSEVAMDRCPRCDRLVASLGGLCPICRCLHLVDVPAWSRIRRVGRVS